MRDKNLHETILVTGGAGFIGSHTLLSLIKDGHTPIIIDNLQNGNSITLDIIKKIVDIKPKFYEGDVRDRILLKKIFNENKIDVVIHFAGLKSVQDSVANPKLYYENNVIGTSILLDEMKESGVMRFIF